MRVDGDGLGYFRRNDVMNWNWMVFGLDKCNSFITRHRKINLCVAMEYHVPPAYIKPPHVGGCYNIIRGNWQGMRRKV